MEIGYFKGNKRVWIRTNDDYLEKLSSGTAVTLWCDGVPGRKQIVYEHSDSDSDDETQRNSTSRAKRMRKSLSEVKNACVQEIFEKLKARHAWLQIHRAPILPVVRNY